MIKPVKIIQYHDDDKVLRRGIEVDGVLFDWSIGSRDEADKYLQEKYSTPGMAEAIRGETIRMFLTHFSEFLGYKITLTQVNQALQDGWLEFDYLGEEVVSEFWYGHKNDNS